MRVRLLPSAHAAPDRDQFLTSYLINDVVAVDAGSLGFGLDASRQARVRDVFLTHSHADHVCSLPVFLENFNNARTAEGLPGPTIHAAPDVLDCLTLDMFNGRVWPELARLSNGGRAFAEFARLTPETPVETAGLRITPVPVDHVVPTMGLIVDDGDSAVVIPSDTGPTERLWQIAGEIPHLRAVFLECTFPDELADLARITGHLTPALFAAEAAKLGPDVTVVAVHMRHHHRERIVRELEALGMEKLVVARPGADYTF